MTGARGEFVVGAAMLAATMGLFIALAILAAGLATGAVDSAIGARRIAAPDCGPPLAPYVPVLQGWAALGVGAAMGAVVALGWKGANNG